ncbi:hypothetical protein OSTOST_18023, partial [Ostertagia ostertagi]
EVARICRSNLRKCIKKKSGSRPIRDAKVALAMDDLRLHSAFELGIALGCDNSTNLEKKAATVGTVVDMLKKTMTLDTVEEYSVVPSANPGDHFTPDQTVMVTSASIPVLEGKHCLFSVPTKNPLLKLYRMGSGEPPYTRLVMAVEKVRYVQASAGVADRLAKTYKLFHTQMSTATEDICPKS